MNARDQASQISLESKVNKAKSLALDLLLPSTQIEHTCKEIDYRFRNCVYSPMVTVWLFISQVISKDHSCQQAINRWNAYRTSQGRDRVNTQTTTYCKARIRLPEILFEKLLSWTAEQSQELVDQTWLLGGRVVELVDGWAVTMADTRKNQKAFPQIKNQKKGCGFPLAKMVGLFNLATGAVQSVAIAPYQGKQTGEPSLLRSMLPRVLPGRILLADRYYANFWLLASCSKNQIDLVARAHQRRKIDFRQGRKLGHQDHVVSYSRPGRPKWMSQDEYRCYPLTIEVRHVRYRVAQKGFRTRQVTIATTLLDAELYPAESLANLYRRRWQVELHIRSIKTQMQMEHLRCKDPSMVRKEIYCHLIGFNLVRTVMTASALLYELHPDRLSFTNAMQALEAFSTTLRFDLRNKAKQWDTLLRSIAEIEVGNRPGRQEERVLKRRPKQYKLMQKPRKPNRNRYANAV